MKGTMDTEVSVQIDAPSSEVWEAITTPDQVKKYLMGTTVKTDWKEGSPIEYSGEYNGKLYHDKGIIKKVIPGKVFQSTYWSSAGGKDDKPENYNVVTYTLDEANNKTTVKLHQDNIATEQEREHLTKNWNMVLGKLKEVVEGK